MPIASSLGRRYWRIWAALAVSSVGDGMVLIALPLLVVGRSHNPLAVAGVLVVGDLPLALAALPVGAIADRVNRRRMAVTVQVLRFASLGAFGLLVLAGGDSLAAIYVTSAVFGSLAVALRVVITSVIPSVVPEDRLGTANGHLYNAEAVGQEIVGRAAGGALVSVLKALPFLADAGGFLVAALMLRRSVPDEDPGPAAGSTWSDLREGLRWYFGHPVLRLLTALIASLAFCQDMVLAVLALYARTYLGLSDAGYGIVLAVASAGNIAGGLAAGRVNRLVGGGVAITAVAVLAAAVYPGLAVTRSPVVATGLMAVESMSVVIGNVAALTLRQRLVPKQMQGRAASAYTAVVRACIPFGGLAGGLVASAWDIPGAFMVAGGLQVAVLAAVAPGLIRRIRSDHPPAEVAAAPER